MKKSAERGSERETKNALLVIGYGNELRSDDGVGPRTAAAVEQWKLPGIRTLACHQLTPELAVPIAESQCVVFVDASVDSSTTVELREMKPAPPEQIMAHAANPRHLLHLAKELFARSPAAFWLTIPIENISFGQALSPRAQEGLQTALEKIRELLSPGD